MRLADARPGQRLRDSLGDEYERTADGARYRGNNAGDGWIDCYDIDQHDRDYGPFALIDDPPPTVDYGHPVPVRFPPELVRGDVPADRWSFASTAIRGDDTADLPEGEGWEPMNVDNGRMWWKRRAP